MEADLGSGLKGAEKEEDRDQEGKAFILRSWKDQGTESHFSGMGLLRKRH